MRSRRPVRTRCTGWSGTFPARAPCCPRRAAGQRRASLAPLRWRSAARAHRRPAPDQRHGTRLPGAGGSGLGTGASLPVRAVCARRLDRRAGGGAVTGRDPGRRVRRHGRTRARQGRARGDLPAPAAVGRRRGSADSPRPPRNRGRAPASNQSQPSRRPRVSIEKLMPMSPLLRRRRVLAMAAALLALASLDAAAQLRRVPVQLVALVGSDRVAAGSTVRGALQVTLPEGLHVQSNKPRDPALIPTELLLEPPTGVRGVEVVFPKARGLPARRIARTAARVRSRVHHRRADERGGGPRARRATPCRSRCAIRPATTRCASRPASAKGEWTFDVVAAGTPVAAQHAALLGRDCVRHG